MTKHKQFNNTYKQQQQNKQQSTQQTIHNTHTTTTKHTNITHNQRIKTIYTYATIQYTNKTICTYTPTPE